MRIKTKKISAVAAAPVLLLCFLVALFCFSGSVKTIDSAAFDSIRSSRDEDIAIEPEAVTVNGIKAVESWGDSWLLCSIPDNTDMSKLSISFQRSSPAMKMAVLDTGYDSSYLEHNQEIRLMVYTRRGFHEYSLHLTTLPIMALSMDDEQSREAVPAEFNGYAGTAHVRGNSSALYPKKGYKVSLNEKVPFLDMREDDDWVLSACYSDQERVRNVFCSNLWYDSCAGENAFNVTNGSEFRFVELFLNGRYHGLYSLGYKPDQKQFGIRDGEYLFSKVLYGDDAYQLQGSINNASQADAWAALRGGYSEDMSSLENLWLFTRMSAAIDNLWKNYYIALKNGTDGLTAVYCPWDMDLTWGNSYLEEAFNHVAPYSVDWDFDVLLTDTGIAELVSGKDPATFSSLKARYADMRAGKWSDEVISGYLDDYESQIFSSGAYRRDAETWPDSSLMDDPDVGLATFREYVFSRISWMDEKMTQSDLEIAY